MNRGWGGGGNSQAKNLPEYDWQHMNWELARNSHTHPYTQAITTHTRGVKPFICNENLKIQTFGKKPSCRTCSSNDSYARYKNNIYNIWKHTTTAEVGFIPEVWRHVGSSKIIPSENLAEKKQPFSAEKTYPLVPHFFYTQLYHLYNTTTPLWNIIYFWLVTIKKYNKKTFEL